MEGVLARRLYRSTGDGKNFAEAKEMNPEETKIVPFAQKVKNVRDLLLKSKPQIEMALPKHVSIDRMLRVAMTAIQRNPKLLECTQVSLLASIMQSAQLGLETDGVLGEAHLVPFGKQVQFIPGYKGLMKLARNSREISTIFASEVYQKDLFSFAYGLDPKLDHIPNNQEDPGPIIAFYAVSKLKDGGSQFVVMWRRQVDGIRDKSPGYIAARKFKLQTPWDTHYPEMGKKTVIRRLCKYLPSSAELQQAIALDEMAEAGIDQNLESIINISPEIMEPEKNEGSNLDAVVDSDRAAEPAPAKSGNTPREQVQILCQRKDIPEEALMTKLGQMGIEDKGEIQHKHMKELIEWATTWRPPGQKPSPTQKSLVKADYDDSN
jgi:recombination protein RecT